GTGATAGPTGGWPFFAASPNGRLLAVISWGQGDAGTIELIDTSDLHVVTRIRYAESEPNGLAFSPDSKTLPVNSIHLPNSNKRQAQSYVRLWDVGSGKPMTSNLPGIPPGVWLWTITFSPDGHTLVGGGPAYATRKANPDDASGRVYLWTTAAPGEPPESF